MDEQSAAWRTKLPKGHALRYLMPRVIRNWGRLCRGRLKRNKRPRVHRVTIAVDLGIAVNPLTIASQFQAGVAFGLTQLMLKPRSRSKMVAWNNETLTAIRHLLSLRRR